MADILVATPVRHRIDQHGSHTFLSIPLSLLAENVQNVDLQQRPACWRKQNDKGLITKILYCRNQKTQLQVYSKQVVD